MGLRINSFSGAIFALRNLKQSDRRLASSLEKLSSGKDLTSSAVDPSRYTQASRLDSQVASLRTAGRNATDAVGLLETAEAALAQVSDLLVEIKAATVYANNTGGVDIEALQAKQLSVDAAVDAINRLALSTTFGSQPLLNGAAALDVTILGTSGLQRVEASRVRFNIAGSATTFTLRASQAASQAVLQLGGGVAASSIAASGGTVLLRVSGAFGSETISLASGATVANVENAIGNLGEHTGVFTSAGMVYSMGWGGTESISLEQVGGTGYFAGGDPSAPGFSNGLGDKARDTGRDAVLTLDGTTVGSKGREVIVNTDNFSGTLGLTQNLAVNTDYQFRIVASGLRFQVEEDFGRDGENYFGIPSLAVDGLGHPEETVGGLTRGGYLRSLRFGQGNDLLSDPLQAMSIAEAAAGQVNRMRGQLGAMIKERWKRSETQLEAAADNLSASASALRDVDFAAEAARLAREQILFQAGTAILAQAKSMPQEILRMLG